MTLHILGIAVEEADNQQPECKANPIDQFWLAASDVLIEIVQRQPDIHTSNQSLTPRLTRAVTSRSPRTIKVARSHSPWRSLPVFGMSFSLMRVSCYSPESSLLM